MEKFGWKDRERREFRSKFDSFCWQSQSKKRLSWAQWRWNELVGKCIAFCVRWGTQPIFLTFFSCSRAKIASYSSKSLFKVSVSTPSKCENNPNTNRAILNNRLTLRRRLENQIIKLRSWKRSQAPILKAKKMILN